MVQYWSDALVDELSQGDLLCETWVGTTVVPRVGLKRGPTAKGGKISWEESIWTPTTDGFGYFLGKGRNIHAIVLSQSCEIDKAGGKLPVLIAPVFPMSNISDLAMQENVRTGRRFAFLPLPAIDGVLTESYADFRAITYLPRAVVDQSERKCSVTDDGADRLAAQLVGFFTRLPFDALSKTE